MQFIITLEPSDVEVFLENWGNDPSRAFNSQNQIAMIARQIKAQMPKAAAPVRSFDDRVRQHTALGWERFCRWVQDEGLHDTDFYRATELWLERRDVTIIKRDDQYLSNNGYLNECVNCVIDIMDNAHGYPSPNIEMAGVKAVKSFVVEIPGSDGDEWTNQVDVVWYRGSGVVMCKPGCQELEPLEKTIKRLTRVLTRMETDLGENNDDWNQSFRTEQWVKRAQQWLTLLLPLLDEGMMPEA